MLIRDIFIFSLLELILISFIWIKLSEIRNGLNHSIRKNNVYLNIYGHIRRWSVPIFTFLILIIFVPIFGDFIESNLIVNMILLPLVSIPIGAFIGAFLSDYYKLKHYKQMMNK